MILSFADAACRHGILNIQSTLRRGLLLVFLSIALCGTGNTAWSAPGDEAVATEARVKAAFLFKFIAYVEWPEQFAVQPGAPIVIGILGGESLADELEQIVRGRAVNEHAISVRRLKPGDALTGLQALFIAKDEAALLTRLAPAAQALAILTVTESRDALNHGSIINFTLSERRVRFEISLESAHKSGLRLSSRLLAVAQDVQTGAR